MDKKVEISVEHIDLKKAATVGRIIKYCEELKEKIQEADELFKNSPELMKVYRDVIKNNSIEVDGMRWPLDTLIFATSNAVHMKVFYAKHIAGCRTSDNAVVIVAVNEEEARALLEKELEAFGIESINPGTGKKYTLHEINLLKQSAVIL